MTDVTTVIPSVVAAPAAGDFRIGRAFSRTFTLLARNFPVYFTIGALGSVPPLLIQKGVIPVPDGAEGWITLAGLLMLVLRPVTQAIMLHVAFQDLGGRPVNLTEAVRAGLGRLLPLIGLSICTGLAFGIGLLLFILPGLILLTMWYVASAACIVERLGVFASMERSSALTKGHRWAIFGTWLLLVIGGAILAPTVDALAGLTGNAGLITAASLAWSAVTTAFGMVFVGVVYYELRVAKEGIDIRQIAAMFE
jgi:hypothetical protein